MRAGKASLVQTCLYQERSWLHPQRASNDEECRGRDLPSGLGATKAADTTRCHARRSQLAKSAGSAAHGPQPADDGFCGAGLGAPLRPGTGEARGARSRRQDAVRPAQRQLARQRGQLLHARLHHSRQVHLPLQAQSGRESMG